MPGDTSTTDRVASVADTRVTPGVSGPAAGIFSIARGRLAPTVTGDDPARGTVHPAAATPSADRVGNSEGSRRTGIRSSARVDTKMAAPGDTKGDTDTAGATAEG